MTDEAPTAGDRFRAEFEAAFEAPSFDYAPLVDAVCGHLDQIERLERDVAERGLTVIGSQGQPVSNSSVAELRHHRSALPRLLAALHLDDEDDDAATQAGRALARARHQKPTMSRKRRAS